MVFSYPGTTLPNSSFPLTSSEPQESQARSGDTVGTPGVPVHQLPKVTRTYRPNLASSHSESESRPALSTYSGTQAFDTVSALNSGPNRYLPLPRNSVRFNTNENSQRPQLPIGNAEHGGAK